MDLEAFGQAPSSDRIEFDDWWSEDGTPNSDDQGRAVLQYSCAIGEFASAVRDELARVKSVHGQASYRERWLLFDFPHRQLDALDLLLANEGY